MAKRKFIVMPGQEDRPYSGGVVAGDFIFLAGNAGMKDAAGNSLEGIEAQMTQCLENLKEVLKAAGSSLSDVVKVNAYLANADDFAGMNKVCRKYFAKDRPARTTVSPALLRPTMLVEIECIAYKP